MSEKTIDMDALIRLNEQLVDGEVTRMDYFSQALQLGLHPVAAVAAFDFADRMRSLQESGAVKAAQS